MYTLYTIKSIYLYTAYIPIHSIYIYIYIYSKCMNRTVYRYVYTYVYSLYIGISMYNEYTYIQSCSYISSLTPPKYVTKSTILALN